MGGGGRGGGVVGRALGVGHHLLVLLLPVQLALSRDGEELGEEDGCKEGGRRGSNGDGHGGVVEGGGGEVVHHWPQGEDGGEAEGGQADPPALVEVLLDVVDGDAAEDVDEEEDVDVDVEEEEGVSGYVALQLPGHHDGRYGAVDEEPLGDDHHLGGGHFGDQEDEDDHLDEDHEDQGDRLVDQRDVPSQPNPVHLTQLHHLI